MKLIPRRTRNNGSMGQRTEAGSLYASGLGDEIGGRQALIETPIAPDIAIGTQFADSLYGPSAAEALAATPLGKDSRSGGGDGWEPKEVREMDHERGSCRGGSHQRRCKARLRQDE
jgi:hypothetical protein